MALITRNLLSNLRLAKRLVGNYAVTFAGEDYLLNLHPARYNYGSNNIVSLR